MRVATFSCFEQVDTPEGKGLFSFYPVKKGRLYTTVSQSRGRLEKEEVIITGLWRLLFFEPGEVQKARGAKGSPDCILPGLGLY
jgi:hypothetical protein